MEGDVQPSELNELFRQNLRARRKELGLTQTDLAARLNELRERNERHKPRKDRNTERVHFPYISALEQGERVPIISTLALLAEALETTPEALLSAPEKIPA